jgi:hypothetical protein
MLLSSGSLQIRQLVYTLTVNMVAAVVTGPIQGEMDESILKSLLRRLTGDEGDMLRCFGLVKTGAGWDMTGREDEVDIAVLSGVQTVASFLGDLIEAAAVSMGA